MGEVKVSVIVPVYNTEQYLPQCLDSLLAQTLTAIEIICINDGSTDTSWDILCDYQKRDARIKIFTQEKSSIGAARNIGIQKAIGNYIGFVDSDDFVDKKMYEILYRRSVQYRLDVTLANINLYYGDYHKARLYRNNEQFQRLENLSPFAVRDAPEVLQNVGIWDKLYNRKFLKQNSLLNPIDTVYEDHLFSFKALVLAKNIGVVNLPLYYYRKSLPNSITGKEIKNDLYKFNFLTISQSIFDFLIQKNMWDVCLGEYVKYLFSNAFWHQSNIESYSTFLTYFEIFRNLLFKNNLINVHTHHCLEGLRLHLYYILLYCNLPAVLYFICFLRNAEKRILKRT